MRIIGLILGILSAVAAVTGLWALALYVGFGPFALLCMLVLPVVYGSILFAYLRYRQGRQLELSHLLTAAAEAEVPLSSALWVYLADRPHGSLRETWVALLLFFFVPGYYWIWHRTHSYDAKVDQVAVLLESGASLHDALWAVQGVASREMLLAAKIGESTGRLAFCLQTLRSPARNDLSGLWLEIVPRIFYPLVLVVVVCSAWGFWTTFIAPKYQKIYYEFGMRIPVVTDWALNVGRIVLNDSWIVGLVCVATLVLTPALILFPTLRWYFPGVGRYYRILVQSRMLQALAMLLAVGKTVPEALGLMADSGYFIAPARWRLDKARRRVEQGEALADSLRRGRILPSSMFPLVQAAERAGNLCWALEELAEHLARRTARRVRRLSLVLFPFPIMVLGLLVAFVVYAFFLPLVQLMEALGE